MIKWLKRLFNRKQEPKSYLVFRGEMQEDGKCHVRAYMIEVDEDGTVTEQEMAPLPEWCVFKGV